MAERRDALDESGRLRSDLWIDQPGAASEIERRRDAGLIDQTEADALEHLCAYGYCVLRPALRPTLFADLLADVERLWREHPPDVAFAYQSLLTRFSGRNEAARKPSCRIADLHTWSETARLLYLDAEIFRFVELAFGEPGIATQSL